LGHLHHWELRAEKDGVANIDYIRLADTVNSEINNSRAEGRYGFEVLQGGVNLFCQNGQSVGKGAVLLEAFSESPLAERSRAAIQSSFMISSSSA
jgi:hypothetical protein